MILNFIDVLCELEVVNEDEFEIVVGHDEGSGFHFVEGKTSYIMSELLLNEAKFIKAVKYEGYISCNFSDFNLEIHIL